MRVPALAPINLSTTMAHSSLSEPPDQGFPHGVTPCSSICLAAWALLSVHGSKHQVPNPSL